MEVAQVQQSAFLEGTQLLRGHDRLSEAPDMLEDIESIA
jgi:hypothetical protein